jgi:hypothetical protein
MLLAQCLDELDEDFEQVDLGGLRFGYHDRAKQGLARRVAVRITLVAAPKCEKRATAQQVVGARFF